MGEGIFIPHYTAYTKNDRLIMQATFKF